MNRIGSNGVLGFALRRVQRGSLVTVKDIFVPAGRGLDDDHEGLSQGLRGQGMDRLEAEECASDALAKVFVDEMTDAV